MMVAAVVTRLCPSGRNSADENEEGNGRKKEVA
jgi:hypothetical protein